jgi:hypothetical protein
MTPALAIVVRGCPGDYRFRLGEQCRCPSIESDLKNEF